MNRFRVDVEKQLSKLGRDLQQFVERVVPLVDEGQDFTPSCDITETDAEFDIHVDLPGLSKEDIELRVTNKVLSIKGERKTAFADDPRYVRRERKHGVFSRTFALPDDVDTDNIEANFNNGVLAIHVPKVQQSEDAKSININ
jgi:HSP20 family protein